MNPQSRASLRRVVFDTSTVISSLLFANGRLAWLREHWRVGNCQPLLSSVTADELKRVLAYPKFRRTDLERIELLAEYFSYCEMVEVTQPSKVVCRDRNDQPFLDLAVGGNANVLVSGDSDLLTLAGKTEFLILTASDYQHLTDGD